MQAPPASVTLSAMSTREAPADIESAIEAFRTDAMYVVAMVEAAGLILHKQRIWATRRADAARSGHTHSSSRTTA